MPFGLAYLLCHPTELRMVKTADAFCCYKNNNVCACRRHLAPTEIFTNASWFAAELLPNSMPNSHVTHLYSYKTQSA